MPEKIVHDQTQDETLKPEEEEKAVGADEPVTKFKCKLNKYGFIGIRKRARPFLPFKAEEPLVARVEGEGLVIRKA